MHRHLLSALLAAAVASFTPALTAQAIISARSGLVNFTQGEVSIKDIPIEVKSGVNPEVKEGETLRTQAGRAEILLNPGTFLRLAEDSSFKMFSNRLIDTRIEILSGSALIEIAEATQPDNRITVLFKDVSVEFEKSGLFRFDEKAGTISCFKGVATVSRGADVLTLKEGKQVTLAAVLAAEKFDTKAGDTFSRWAERRSRDVATANISAAKYMGSTYTSNRGASGNWLYNPYFGLFTYIPSAGTYFSPYGYSFYSPVTVVNLYNPARYARTTTGNPGWASNNSYNSYTPTYTTATRDSSTFSPASTPSSPASSPRGGDSGMGHVASGGSGGRGR